MEKKIDENHHHSDEKNDNGWANIWKIFGCIKPVLSLIGGKSYITHPDQKKFDRWEILFEIISGNYK